MESLKPGWYQDAVNGKHYFIVQSFPSVLQIPSTGRLCFAEPTATFFASAILVRMKPPYPETILSVIVNHQLTFEAPLPELCATLDKLNDVMQYLQYPNFEFKDFALKLDKNRDKKLENFAAALTRMVCELSKPIVFYKLVIQEGDCIEVRTSPKIPLPLVYLLGIKTLPL